MASDPPGEEGCSTVAESKFEVFRARSKCTGGNRIQSHAEFMQLRQLDKNGKIQADGTIRALGAREALIRPKLKAGGIERSAWTSLGPTNISGRLGAILPHPTVSGQILVGTESGGLWRTDDAGAHWRVVDDFIPNASIACLVRHPANPQLIFACTGYIWERGFGILKSIDDGVTWASLQSTDPLANPDWFWVTSIAISPANPDVMLAATVVGYSSGPSEAGGVNRTTNGGASWTRVYIHSANQVKFDPNDPNKALLGEFLHTVDGVDHGGAVAYSNDAGATWTRVPIAGTNKVRFDHAASVPGTVLASIDNNGGEIYRSTNGGASWTLVANPRHLVKGPLDFNNIWVDPLNASRIVIAGGGIYSTTDGSNFREISWASNIRSGDFHAIVPAVGYNGGSQRTVYLGDDAGFLITPDPFAASPTAQRASNSLVNTQFYAASGDTRVHPRIVGGVQDYYTQIYDGVSSSSWSMIFGGDGGVTAVDPQDASTFYGESEYFVLQRSSNGGVSGINICAGITDGCGVGFRTNFIAPFVLDPNNNNRILAGGEKLWRSNNVKAASPSWTAIKNVVPPPSWTTAGNFISAVAVALGNPDIIWVGHNYGDLFKTANGTAASPTWVKVPTPDTSFPYISKILIDPADPKRFTSRAEASTRAVST